MKVNIAKWPKRVVAAILAVLLAITFLPFSQLNITKAEEGPNSLSAETERYQATVSFGDDAGIPEGAYLTLTELSEDSPEFAKAREAIINDDNGLYEVNLGMAAFDLTIYDVDGFPIEPSAAVQVNIQMKSLPETADKVELENTMAIRHLDESTGEVLVDTVASVAAEENGDIVVADDSAAADFTVESFSTFALTWENEAGNPESATIHWGTLGEGDSFNEFDAAILDTSAASVSLANTYDGYVYVGAYYTTDEITVGIDIDEVLTKTANGWQTKATIHNVDDSTTTDPEHMIPDGAHIYVLYAQKSSGNTPPENPQSDTKPTVKKNVTPNSDGTQTIRLEVTAPVKEDVQQTGANVLLVLDTTYSMASSMQGAANRFEAARSAALTLIDALDCGTNDIDLALVEFNATGSVVRDWTKNYTEFRNYIANTAQHASGPTGTNWQSGLYRALGLVNSADGDATYVIFLSDGEPNRRGDTTSQNCNATQGVTYAQPHANSIAQAATLYGVFCGTATGSGNMNTLIRNANGNTDNVIIATDSQAINDAFDDIASTIIENLGSSNYALDDGIPTLSGISAMVGSDGEVDGFKYEIKGPNDTTFSTWSEAPGASYSSDNGVTWDLTKAGTLAANTTYALEFTVWPSQEAYDLIANLNNGLVSWDNLDDSVKAQIDKNGNTYTLKTNTHLKQTYSFNGQTFEDPVTFKPGSMPLVSYEMDVFKEWDDSINPRNRTDKVDFYLLVDGKYYQNDGSFKDGDDAKDNAYILETEADEWTDSVQIAPGFATLENGVLDVKETGHKYQLEEIPSTDPDYEGYSQEFTTQTVRPMVINGTLTNLVLVDDDNPAPSGATTYKIGTETYFVSATASSSITGTNHKTAELDITKAIDSSLSAKTEAELNAETFTYDVEFTVPEGGDVSGINYWIYEADASGWTLPEYDSDGLGAGYAPFGHTDGAKYSGEKTTIGATASPVTATVTIKRNQVVRFTNLPTGTKYTIIETQANGQELSKQGYTVKEVKSTNGKAGTETIANDKITGEIEAYNTRYYNQFTNKLEAVDAELKVTKALDGYAWADGDDSYEFTLTATGDAPLPYKNASEGNKVTVTSDELTKSFGLIRFTAAGKYKYTITETKPEDADPNIVYSDPVEVTVTVTQDDAGKFVVEKIEGTDTTFTAATTGAPASSVTKITNKIAGRDLTVTKTFSGIDALPSAFKIAVAYTDATGAKTAELKTTDEKVTVSEDGKTYTWKIEKIKPNTTVTAEESGYAVTDYATTTGVVATGATADTTATKATFSMPNSDGTTVAFTNNYANVTIDTKAKFFKKNVTTPNAVKDATFNFSAVQVDADGNAITGGWSKTGSVTYTAGTSGEKNVDFGLITYTTAGTYYYKITETSLPTGWTATPESKTATVTVVVTGSATAGLTAEVTEASISNAYTPEPVTISFPVKKELVAPEGTSIPKGLSIKELFTLTLEAGTNTAGDGVETPVPTVKSYKNPADDGGVVTFGDIEFTKAGTYNYTVKETGTVDGITNDTAATTGKTVTVTVVDDGEGTLSATASSTTAEPVTFTNTLAFGTLEITKDLSVYNDFVNSTTNTTPDNVTFTFEIIATWNGTQIYKDYKALTFAQAQASTITIANKLPLGSVVTIKEIYPGAGYTPTPEGSDTVNIEKMTTTATAAFKNAYNNTIIGGYGIVNHFTQDENDEWSGENIGDNSSSTEN